MTQQHVPGVTGTTQLAGGLGELREGVDYERTDGATAIPGCKERECYGCSSPVTCSIQYGRPDALGVMHAAGVLPSDEDQRLQAAGFDLADDLDRPDKECDCVKCKAFYASGVQEVPRG